MTHRVGPKGQVVIPKRVREELGIRPGDEVVVEAVDGEARVARVIPLARLRGAFSYVNASLTRELEDERRRDRDREEGHVRRGRS
jgi:antitoxin PrlF